MIKLLIVLLSFWSLLGGGLLGNVINDCSPKTDEVLVVNKYRGAEEYYNDIPVSIREAFENSGWNWYVYEDGPLARKYNYPVSIMGMTDWVNKEITVDYREESQEAIIHEIGHWANHYYNKGINQMLLREAYKKEWETLYREYGGSIKNYDSVEEYGASAFEHFITEPEKLEKVAPCTYSLMESFISASENRAGSEKTNLWCVNDGSYDFGKVEYVIQIYN